MICMEMVYGNNTQKLYPLDPFKAYTLMVPYFNEFATKTLVLELNEVVFSKRPTMVKG